MAKISEQLTELITQRNNLADNISAKGISADKTEKYNTLIDKVNDIEVVNAETLTLENTAKYNDTPESIVNIEYPETKNLVKSLKTTGGNNVSIVSNTTVKLGTKNKDTYFSFYPSENLIKGQVYTISCEASNVPDNFSWEFALTTDNTSIGLAININKNGKCYFSKTLTKDITAGTLITFDDQIRPSTIPNEITLTNFQLELGLTATTYEPFKTYDIGVQLSSKNLIPYPYLKTSFTHNGITYTVNSDGTIVANGTFENINDTSYVTLTIPDVAKAFKLPLGYTYIISGAPEIEGVTTIINYCNLRNGKALDNASSQNGNSTIFTTSTDVDMPGVQIQLKSQGTVTTVENVVFKPQLEIGSNTTSYSKYISDFSSVNVTACGKNLFNINNRTEAISKGTSQTLKRELTGNQYFIGITGNNYWQKLNIKEWTIEGSTVTVLNSNTGSTGYGIGFDIRVKPNTTYFVTHNSNDNGIVNIGTYTSDGTWKRYLPAVSTFTTKEDENWIVLVCLQKGVDITINTSTISNVQLEISDTPTSYSPCQGTTYTADSTGKISDIQNYYPITNLISDSNTTMTVLSGTYKTITPSSDKNSFNKIYQPTLDSSIDSNIKPEYIRKGVTILGVTGTYEPTTTEES